MDGVPKVVLIGRQNVGKSALFNTLIEERRAIVSAVPGTTRDRNHAVLRWRGRSFELIDTGGIEERPHVSLSSSVRQQAEVALKHADVACFVVDGRSGCTADDQHIARLLHRHTRPVVLVVNKVDNPRVRASVAKEIAALGFHEQAFVSAKNGSGTGDLLDILLSLLPPDAPQPSAEEIRLILIGRTNVGKSSLLNRLIGERRVIVSSEPHTTRDPQDVVLTTPEGSRIRIIDTAGQRRPARLRKLEKHRERSIERESAELGLSMVRSAQVAALMLEAPERPTHYDRRLLQLLEEAGVGIMLVVNKSDLLPKRTTENLRQATLAYRADLPFASWAPLLFTSARTGEGLDTLLTTAQMIAANRARRLTDRSLERFMKKALTKRRPPRSYQQPVRLVALTQIGIEPPTFRLLVGPRQTIPLSYQRFLLNELRAQYGLVGTPLRLRVEPQRRT